MKTILLLIGLFFITTYTFAQSNLNWVTLNTGTTEKINDIYFQSPDVGYIVGENYLFKKTIDGGMTWINLTPPSIGEKPNNNGNIIGIDLHEGFSFSNTDSALCLTWEKAYHGVLTRDEGASYSVFSYLDSNQFCTIDGFSILPSNGGNGYINLFTYGQDCNGDAVYHNFYDGPFSISYANTSISNKSGSFTTVDVDSFSSIFGHDNGYLLRYGGAFSSPIPDSIYLDSTGVSAVAYAGNNKWYASTNRDLNNLYISTDSGKTFTVDPSFPNTFVYPKINDFSFLPNGVGIAASTSTGGYGSIVLRTLIGWEFYPSSQALNAAKLFGNGIAYVAGDSGLVMKTTILTSIYDVKGGNIPLQAYPNPVSNFLQLDGLDNISIDAIQLFDIHGRLINTFSSDSRKLDLSSYSKGTYIIKVQTRDQQLSKKLIIK
ncbi:MAG: T9SS type A sorting domain-containing protein [Flavobacteriales bacterium]|nr:T9SS type A sorting domain-containing protein [Flavobacteriales bacterium]